MQKKKLHLLWKIPLLLLILILIINIFDFVGVSKIKIVDSITNKPLENIHLTQSITGEISRGPAGPDNYQIRILDKDTNSDGIATFPLKFHIHIPLFKWFNEERIVINQHGKNLSYNNDYYISSVEFGIQHLLPFKTKTIELTPYVDDLSKCQNDKDCIFYNSLYLAFINNDESYCKNLLTYKNDKGEFLMSECYSIIALSKKDIKLCENVPESAYRGKAQCIKYIEEDGQWGKEVCNQFYYGYNRTFIACDNLLDKYGCKRNSENCFIGYD